MAEISSGAVVRRNVVFNVIGGVWVAAISLISIPLQLRLLGAEIYGLIGFVATALIALTLLEFGLSTTIVREIASDTSEDRRHTKDLIRTASLIYWLAAVLVGMAMFISADWLAGNWLTLIELTPDQAAVALRLLALNLMLTWPCSVYVSVLTGLQRLDTMNTLRVVGSTLSLGGGSLLLLAGGSFTSFVWWLIGASVITTSLYVAACLPLLPRSSLIPGFSLDAFRRVRRFSLDVYVLGLIGMLIVNVDKLLISNVVSLVALGFYSLAGNGARVIVLVQDFINGAVMPALSKDYAAGDMHAVSWRFEKYAQVLVYVVSLPAAGLIIWGRPILELITTPEAATETAPVLALLAAGFWVNAALSSFYVLTVAANRTRIPVWVNLIGIVVYLPLLYVLITNWGLIGAGVAWVILNIYYLVVFYPLAYGVLPDARRVFWLARNLITYAAAALGIFWLGYQAVQGQPLFVVIGGGLLTGLVYLVVGYLLLFPTNREDIHKAAARWLPAVKER